MTDRLSKKCVTPTTSKRKVLNTGAFHLKIGLMGLFFWIGILPALAQDKNPGAEELLRKSMTFYENHPSFSASLQYRLFRSPKNPVEIENYKGVLIRKEKDTYLKIHQTEFITVDGMHLKINHEEKAMEYWKNAQMASNNNPLDIETYLKYFAENKVKKTNKSWVVTLVTPKFTQLPYGSIELHFSETNFMLQKQVIELVSPGSIKDEKGELTPERKFLEITISAFDQSPNNMEDHLDLNKFMEKRGDKFKPVSKYKSYEFIVK